jgi:hypothetical protein
MPARATASLLIYLKSINQPIICWKSANENLIIAFVFKFVVLSPWLDARKAIALLPSSTS